MTVAKPKRPRKATKPNCKKLAAKGELAKKRRLQKKRSPPIIFRTYSICPRCKFAKLQEKRNSKKSKTPKELRSRKKEAEQNGLAKLYLKNVSIILYKPETESLTNHPSIVVHSASLFVSKKRIH